MEGTAPGGIKQGAKSVGRGPPRAGVADAVAPPGSPRFKSSDNKVTTEDLPGVVAGCRCRARICATCGPRMGWVVRQVLGSKLELWQAPKLFTLTVDRRRFGDPRQAWEHITEGKFIWRLMRALGITRWLWVLEFQTQTGAGWPHWHLLIDVGDLPRHRVDLAKAWRLWRDEWGLGGLDLAKKETRIGTPQHAVFYITKYLTKHPRGGYPLWVMEANGIRFLGASRAVGRLVSPEGSPVTVNAPGDAEPESRGPRRSLLDRSSGCKQECSIFRRSIHPGTGEERYHFAGSLPCSPSRLALLSIDKKISAHVTIEINPNTLTPLVCWHRGDVDRVRAELVELGALTWLRSQTEESKMQILEENLFAKRVESTPEG